MAEKKKSSRRKSREKNFIIVSCAFIVLALAALITMDGHMRFRPDQPPEQWEAFFPGVPARDTPVRDAQGSTLSAEAIAWFSKQKGVQAHAPDTLSSPQKLPLTTEISEKAFGQLLEGFMKNSSSHLFSYSWDRQNQPPRFTIVLSRGKEELVLMVSLGTIPPRLNESARPVQAERSTRPQEKAAQPSRERTENFAGARVALILDDAGGAGEGQWAFLRLPAKLTFAVLPNLANSRRFAEEARAAGHEVIIHLPMQPLAKEGQTWGGEILTPGMDERDIGRFLDSAIQSVPGALGINNHMGSLATSDRSLMGLLMPAIRVRGLFFVDSFTHSGSVAMEEAVRAGMPARRRDVFIDHVASPVYIENALRRLIREAAARGSAIGIGHVTHPVTWRVLRDQLPAYIASGVRFVGISEIP
jgi:hypothetical protein